MKYEECVVGKKVRLRNIESISRTWIGKVGEITKIERNGLKLPIQITFTEKLLGSEVNWFHPNELEIYYECKFL